MLVYKEPFLLLIRLGIGHHADVSLKTIDWFGIKALAERHGLSAVFLDGIEKVKTDCPIPLDLKLQWIGETLQEYEGRYKVYEKAIGEMASFYNSHGLKMMVLKGYACSLDWPKPDHRPCGDIDIWQFGLQKEADTLIAKEYGIIVDDSHHHHTVFTWGEFMVENHYDFINTHRHYSHRGLEKIFKELGQDDSHYVDLKGEKVYLPSPNLHALFLIRHALNHFASTGINLRQILDWAFFAEKHTDEIDWDWLIGVLEDYHMTDFFSCLNAICVEDLGFSSSIFHDVQSIPEVKDKVLCDILFPKYIVKNRIANMLKRWIGNQWKHKFCYKESMLSALWNGAWSYLMKPRYGRLVFRSKKLII